MLFFIAATQSNDGAITSEIQKLEPSAIIELFELDATAFGGDLLRFHAGTNGVRQNLVWQGNTYTAFPVQASGFDMSGNGQLPRPKLQVANVTGAITLLVLTYDDLLGAKVTRKRTMAKYLDAVNYPSRRNLLRYSTDFSSVWASSTATRNVNAAVAPDGSATAMKLVPNTSLSAKSVEFYQLNITTAGVAYTLSVYAKAAGYDRVVLWWPNTGAANTFDLSAGTLIGSGGATGSIVSVGDGWYRCTSTYTQPTANGPAARFYIAQPGTTGSAAWTVAADGVSGIYLWGAQLEAGSAATEYQAIGATFNGNPTADPAAEFPDDVFFIDRKATETRDVVEFELAAAFDVAGVQLPRRQIIQNVCTWRYRGTECGYTGTNYFDANDQPVGSVGLDVCAKRLGSCKARFGANSPLPFGSFPAAGLTR